MSEDLAKQVLQQANAAIQKQIAAIEGKRQGGQLRSRSPRRRDSGDAWRTHGIHLETTSSGVNSRIPPIGSMGSGDDMPIGGIELAGNCSISDPAKAMGNIGAAETSSGVGCAGATSSMVPMVAMAPTGNRSSVPMPNPSAMGGTGAISSMPISGNSGTPESTTSMGNVCNVGAMGGMGGNVSAGGAMGSAGAMGGMGPMAPTGNAAGMGMMVMGGMGAMGAMSGLGAMGGMGGAAGATGNAGTVANVSNMGAMGAMSNMGFPGMPMGAMIPMGTMVPVGMMGGMTPMAMMTPMGGMAGMCNMGGMVAMPGMVGMDPMSCMSTMGNMNDMVAMQQQHQEQAMKSALAVINAGASEDTADDAPAPKERNRGDDSLLDYRPPNMEVIKGLTDQRYEGKITFWHHDQGYGFIKCPKLNEKYPGHDIFLHKNQKGRFEEGDPITFSVFLSFRNKPQATELRAAAPKA